MRKWIVGVVAVASVTAVVWATSREPAAARPTPRSEARPSEEVVRPPPMPVAEQAAPPAESAPQATAEAPPPEQTAAPEPFVPPVPTVFPPSLDAVPSTPWREEQLARLTPQDRLLLDYKLGLMDRMRSCLEGRELSAGRVEVFLHFRVDGQRWQGVGEGADLLDSSLDRESDAPFLECLEAAHTEAALPFDELPDADEFHWATHFDVPLEEDDAYLFFVR